MSLSLVSISNQLVQYIKDDNLLPDLQSAYRANHLTEMAVLKILADILWVLDLDDLVVFMIWWCLCSSTSLLLSTASITTLLQWLHTFCTLDGGMLNWLVSYLHCWLQHVHISGSNSSLSLVLHGVTQRSVLGPTLFLLYSDLQQVIKTTSILSIYFR